MSQRMKISDEITVGPQPSADEIEKIAGEGFASLINFRTAGEDDQPLSPDAEQQKVESNGLKYLHIPGSTGFVKNTANCQSQSSLTANRESGRARW